MVVQQLRPNAATSPRDARQGTTARVVGAHGAVHDSHELGEEFRSCPAARSRIPVVPSLPAEATKTIDGWKQWADHFNRAGAAARKAGIWLGFHNEPNHTKPIGGVVPYEVFLSATDPALVRHQLDVGNMAMGGGDPLAYLTKYRDRYWSFHIKDVVADRSKDTELGKGTIDFRRFLAAVPDIGRKPVFVEQEAWADSMASARMNFEYLSKLEF